MTARATANSRLNRVTLEPGSIISNYQIIKLVGQGGYGDVYKARDMNKRKIVALKTEYVNAPKKAIEKEINVLKAFSEPCFPGLLDYGMTDEVKFLVMPLFGKSLGDYRKNLLTKTISPAILISMAIEMIHCIQRFHEKGYIHRDVKPSNFLINKNEKYPLVLIDFGLSRKFIDQSTGKPIPPDPSPHFGGTKKYASINLHDNKDSSRVDDLISWFYSIVECWRGRLPWATMRDKEETGASKRGTTPRELCGSMPEQFPQILEYLLSLGYYDQPDYGRLIRLLNNAKTAHCNSSPINWVQFYYSVHPDEKKSQKEENFNPDEADCCNIA